MSTKDISKQLSTYTIAEDPGKIYEDSQGFLAKYKELEEVRSSLADEWRKLQIAKNREMMDDEQIMFALRAYIKRHIQPEVENTVVHEPTQTSTNHKSIATTTRKRPLLITAFCILGTIGAIFSFFQYPAVVNTYHMPRIYLAFFIISSLLALAHYSGLWLMKKWNIPFYIFQLIIGMTLHIFNGFAVFTGAVGTVAGIITIGAVAAYSYMLYYYYPRMD